jgi:hypothetical protein
MSEKVIEQMLRGDKTDEPGNMTRPEPGSEEERAFLEAAWQQPEIRAAMFAKHGPQLEAMGFKPDGTLPMNPKIPVRNDSLIIECIL